MTEPAFLTGRPRPAVRIERRYDHPIERVWRAVTDPGSLAQWFPTEIEFDLRKGGVVRYDPNGGGPYDGQVLEADPPHRLVFTWDTDQLEFDLRAEDGGTVFVLTHLFEDRAGAASFATGWEQCLAGLWAVLADERLPEPGKSAARHEQLVEQFGLDRPQVTRTDTGWRLHFERQLTCSAKVAWDLFFGTDPATGELRQAPGVGGQFRPYAAPEVLLGIATAVDAPHEFAFDVAEGVPGDTVLLQLGDGTGHGARLFLEVAGTADEELEAAIDVWGSGAIAQVARDAARLASA